MWGSPPAPVVCPFSSAQRLHTLRQLPSSHLPCAAPPAHPSWGMRLLWDPGQEGWRPAQRSLTVGVGCFSLGPSAHPSHPVVSQGKGAACAGAGGRVESRVAGQQGGSMNLWSGGGEAEAPRA